MRRVEVACVRRPSCELGQQSVRLVLVDHTDVLARRQEDLNMMRVLQVILLLGVDHQRIEQDEGSVLLVDLYVYRVRENLS